MGFKYIVISVKVGSDGDRQLLPIIFPDALCHKNVLGALYWVVGEKRDPVIDSAGFISLDARHCAGRSETLEINSKLSDRDLINSFPYEHGLVFNGDTDRG